MRRELAKVKTERDILKNAGGFNRSVQQFFGCRCREVLAFRRAHMSQRTCGLDVDQLGRTSRAEPQRRSLCGFYLAEDLK